MKQMYVWFQTNRKNPKIITIVAMSVVVIILGFNRYLEAKRLKASTDEAAKLRVNVVVAQHASKTEHVILPGSVLAWHEASIFARAKGYLKTWYVDIGYKVHRGDVLAIIERPELDAELREAEDHLNTVIAQYKLARITAKRWGNLVKTDSVSKQANDNKNYQAQALQAEVSQARANVERLRAYVSFEKVIAPFDGTISLRQTDIGDLINVGSQPAQMRPLFKMVQTNPLRLYVNIPQTYTTRIQPGMKVSLRFMEHPGQVFHGQLLKTAGAVDPKTLTMQAEFKVENPREVLIPGSYTVVDFTLPSIPTSVILPVNVLIFRAQGLQLAVINAHNRVELRHVEVGTDFGLFVQINSGVRPGERVVINPMDVMYAGQSVHAIPVNMKTMV